MLALAAFAFASTITIASPSDGLRWSITLDEGWKPSEELEQDVMLSMGKTSIPGRMQGGVQKALLDMLGTPEEVRVAARLQICREDVCKKVVLEARASVADLPGTFELTDHPDAAKFEAMLATRAEKQAENQKALEALEATYDKRYMAALDAKADKVLAKTFKRSRKRDVPALIVLGGMGCKPCGELAHDLFYVDDDPGELAGRVEWALVDRFDSSITETAASWEVTGLPTSMLVAPDGSVMAKLLGYSDVASFDAWLTENL